MRLLLQFVLLVSLATPVWAGPQSLRSLDETYQALILDGSLSTHEVQRLRIIALSDDLRIDPQEAQAIRRYIQRSHSAEFGGAPSIEASWGGNAPPGWAARTQRLLVELLNEQLGSQRQSWIFRELTAIALRPLTDDERLHSLDLVDHFHEVSRVHRTRDAVSVLSVLFSNPDEFRTNREYLRRLEILGRQFNIPVLLNLGASASIAP